MKRVLSLLLAIVMVFGLIPMAAFADGEPIISFETTFVDTMTVGDTFTVTGSLANNPGIATMTLSLQWNEDAVKFSGFETEYDEDEEADVLKSDVFGAMATVVNHDLGIIAGARTQGTNTKKNGTLFVANFEIVGSGDLDIALKDADATEFEMANADMEDIAVTFDYSAIENLSVAAPEAEGPAIPDGAPFTAITTDGGDVISIEQQENVSFNYADVPYYIVTIPADVTTVYVTDPNQVVMQDYTSGEMKATAYAADIAGGWSQLYVNYDYTEVADGIQVTIPMNMTAEDWSVGTVEMCFVDDGNGSLTHAYGSEDSSYACTFLMSFEYAASSSAPVEPEEPTVSEIPAGAAFVDMIARVNGEDKPVTIEVMDDHYKVLVPLGTTAVYVIYDEGVPKVDQFGFAAVNVTGVEGVGADGYSQSTSSGKTTVGLLMTKAAANGAPTTIDLISLDYANRTAVGIMKADNSAEDWFSFTYQLSEGEHYAILPEGIGYTVTGSPIASDGYTFQVSLEDGYEATADFAVKVNGENVATQPGQVSVPSVTEDLKITVEGVAKIVEATDISITLDLTDYTGTFDGYLGYTDRNYNSDEVDLQVGKSNTLALKAADNGGFYAQVYEIGPLVTGWMINDTAYYYPNEYKTYSLADGVNMSMNPTDGYFSVDITSTTPYIAVIKPIVATAESVGAAPDFAEDCIDVTDISVLGADVISSVWDGDTLNVILAEDTALDAALKTLWTIPVKNSNEGAGNAMFNINGRLQTPGPNETYTWADNLTLAEGVANRTYVFEAANTPWDPNSALTFTSKTFTVNFYVSGKEPAPEPTTYTITAQQPTGGTVTVLDQDGNEITQAAEGDGIFLQYEADEGYRFKHYLINGAVVTEDALGMTNGFYLMPAENITVTAVFESTAEGYFFATSADVSTENGGTAVVHVKVTGHSDENITGYNAYDVTLTFDETKLEYVDFDGAVKSDNGQVKVEGNTIRIVGCGADKDFGTEIARLTFKTKAEGAAQVTVSKAQVSDKEESVTEDIPEATPKHDENDTTADTTPDQSVVLVPYTVTKPDFVSGETSVLHGEDYTFSFTDTDHYDYTGLTVTVGSTPVTPNESEGVYTIANVTGAVTIEVTKTAKSYNVNKPATVTGPDKATYGTDYIFTVTPSEGKEIESVKATIGGEEEATSINTDGAYVIEGGSISGEITITVTEKDAVVPETKYTNVTFSGITAEEIEGGQLTQKVEAGKDFSFKLLQAQGVTYTVKVGEEVLTAAEDGTYTIPAAKMIEGDLTVTIEKAEIINVEVAEYIKLDGQAMFLITAKSAATDSVLKYGEETMYHSSKYSAYSWLVISAESAETVKAEAQAAIAIAETGTTAPEVAYNYDVNGTTKVDVNDAQLAYDMYNAEYAAFSDSLTVRKFLEADLDGSKNLGTQDVAAIINFIVNGTAN